MNFSKKKSTEIIIHHDQIFVSIHKKYSLLDSEYQFYRSAKIRMIQNSFFFIWKLFQKLNQLEPADIH